MTNNIYLKSVWWAIIMVVFFGITAFANTQNTFTFQGRLENNNGSPISSTLNMTFKIYDNHYVSLTTSTNGAHTHSYQKGDPGDNSISDNSGSFDEYDDMSATTGSAGNHNHTVSGNTGSKGSGGAHNNLQPYITLNYIIKY
jgi:microcystin-dependent protein